MPSEPVKYLVLLILAKQDVECTCEAPYCEDQQEQEPLDVLDDRPQRVHERVLGGLQNPVHHSDQAQTCWDQA